MSAFAERRPAARFATRTAARFAACLAGLFFANAAWSADEAPLNADAFDFDLFTPTGPALVTLGVTPRRSNDPGVQKDFAFDIGNVSADGRSSIGASASIMPFWLGQRDVSLAEYREDYGKATRMLARARTSFGAARAGTEARDALRLAVGAETQLLDAQDHRFDKDAYECLSAAFDAESRTGFEADALDLAAALRENPDLSAEDLFALQTELLGDQETEGFEAAREACRDRAIANLLARPSWLVGVGAGFRSEAGDLGDFAYDGVAVWTSYRQPLTDDGRIAAFGLFRGEWDRDFDLTETLTREGDAIEAGGGLAYQRPRFRVDASATYNRRDVIGADADAFVRYNAIVDVRVREGLWAELSGGYTQSSDFDDGLFGGVNLKVSWGDQLGR